MAAPERTKNGADLHDTLYRGLLRHALIRLIFLYFIPLLLLTLFFHLEYRLVVRDEVPPPEIARTRMDGPTGDVAEPASGLMTDIATSIWWFSALFCLIGGLVIWLQARWVARQQYEARLKEQQLNRQLGQAAKLALVGELAAGIAHEINNPLAVVAEKAGLVKDLLDPRFDQDSPPGELRAHLDTIEDAVYRCTDITRQLLGFVREREVELKETDLHHLVDDLADGLLGPELEVADISVAKQYDRSMPPVTTDPGQLRQVVLNLLKNAADSITGPGAITIATKKKGDRFTLTVADTGHGMTAEELELVFIPFFTTKAPGKGTGLGLSVSYGIIEGLGGHMTVNSTPAEGSEFIVELPLRS